MAESDVTIVVRSRDMSDPNKVRQRWRAAAKDIERDQEESSRRGGEKAGKSWMSGFASGGSSGGGFDGVMSKIVGSYTSVFKLSAKTAATAFSAQFVGSVVAGLASGAAKVAHGAAAMAALLPAAAVAGVAAMTSLKLAVAGVGDALSAAVTGDAEEFKESIKDLSPAARSFAREVRGMKDGLLGLRSSVQEGFFSQFEGQTSKLAKTWLPILRRELTGVSSLFGGAADRFAGWARTPAVVLTLSAALRNVRATLGNLLDGASNLPAVFTPLVAVGSTFLPRLTDGFADATAKAALFMQQAADTGKLANFIQGGLDKLRSLGDTFTQVWRIGENVVAVFKEFGGLGGLFAGLGIETGGILDTLEQLSIKARVFFQSAAGGWAVTEIFSVLRSVLNATMGTLAHLVPIIGRAFAPLLPQLSKFAEAVANLQLALADALAPALEAVATALGIILPPMTAILNAFADSGPAASYLAGILITLYGAWKLQGTVAKIAETNVNLAKIGFLGAASAAVGMAMALKQINDANRAKDIENIAEQMSAWDGAITKQSTGLINLMNQLGRLDELMTTLIDTNPRLAQEIINNADAYGISEEQAAGYQNQLDTTTAAQNNLTDAITRTNNALKAQRDPVFGAIDAQRTLADAKVRLLEVAADEESTAADVAAAQDDVTRAAFDQQEAMLTLAAAVQNGEVSAGAFLAQLKLQVKQGNITRETYNSMATTARGAFGGIKSAIESVPTSRRTTVTASDRASRILKKIRDTMAQLNGSTATVNVAANISAAAKWAAKAAGGYAHGGITGAGQAASGGVRNGMTWVGERGPELVNLAPGSQVHSNPDSMRMAGAGGGGNLTLTWQGAPTDPLGKAMFDWFRKNIQVSYGGDVTRALG